MHNPQQVKRLSFLFFACCLIFSIGNAQEIRENEKGEKIIVYPDGRVEFFNGQGGSSNSNAADAPSAIPVFNGYIEPLDGSLAVNKEHLYKIAVRKSQIAQEAAEVAQLRAAEAQQNLARLEVLPEAERSPYYAQQLEAARNMLRQTSTEMQEAIHFSQEAETLTEKGGFVEQFNNSRKNSRQAEERSNSILLAADQSYSELIPLMENYAATQRENLLETPPANLCQYAYNGTDEGSAMHRRDLAKQFLFTYTDDRLRTFLKDKEYLSCDGFLSSLGGYRFLTLSFTFAYPNAREAYGFIDQNSVLTVKLLNGDFVNLRADHMARGSYDTIKEELTYEVLYPIDRSQINTLKSSELDFIRVFWSSGFEEYQVYQLDFFQRQFECLGD